MKQRSKGITIFAVLTILSSLFSLLMTYFIVHLNPELTSGNPQASSMASDLANSFSTPMAILFGPVLDIACIIIAFSLLKLRSWARWAIIIVAVFSIIQTIKTIIFSSISISDMPIFTLMLGILWDGLVIWFFLRSQIRAQFIQAKNSSTG